MAITKAAPVKGEKLISDLKKKLKTGKDIDLIRKIDISTTGLSNLRSNTGVKSTQIATLISKAYAKGAKDSFQRIISPVVEFYPITPDAYKGKNRVVFTLGKEDGDLHEYKSGLQAELEKHQGVYVFFDSRGQAMYVGRTNSQTLWVELNSAFNRSRGDVQNIKRVTHPSRNQPYRTSDEKQRAIKTQNVYLSDLAYYFSAYEVSPPLIKSVEAMLIRCFANNLLNIKMESFSNKKQASKPKAKKRKTAKQKVKKKAA